MANKVKLGVNIDHVATLRQARLADYPDIVEAAKACISGGADGIVMHLREDRRHIQDEDIYNVRKEVKTRLDMEMAATEEMLKIALDLKPDMVTLVPEKRQELTTEGGLDVLGKLSKLKLYISKLQDKGIIVSLFVDPDRKQIEASKASGAKFVEIHTGAYADSKAHTQEKLEEIKKVILFARELNLKVNAGHGLTHDNVRPITIIDGVEELNIGFSIIARALFVGLERSVKEMVEAMKR